ncbi:hypothetical protein Tco_0581585 [Tanacetum coccineum]
MSTLVFVDPESSTQVDRAQSSRVPVPLPKDPYEAIRQAYLDGTDTESEPFEDPIDTETPELPLTVTPPTSLPESAPPVLVPILRMTARMAVRVPPAMSSGLSASIVEVAAMSDSAFLKDSKEDDDEEDKEIEESLDSDSVSEDSKDEGSTVKDEDPAAGDEGLAARVEGPYTDDESYGLDDESCGLDDEGHSVKSNGLGLEEEEKAVPGGQQQAALVVRAAVSAPLGLGYKASRRRELALEEDQTTHTSTWTDPKDGMVYIDVPTYPPPAPPVQTPPSPEWTSSSLPISPSPSVVPSPASSPMIPLTAPSPVALPATAETEGFLTKLGAQVQMQRGLIHDHAVGAVREEIFFKRYRFRSIEYEQEWVTVTFGAIWRQVLALESWVGQTDAQRETLWHAISDMQGENRDLWLQLVEERSARLELVEVVDSMRRGQEPRGSLRLVARDIAGTHFLIRIWRTVWLVYSVGSECIRADHFYRLVRRSNRKVIDRGWS